MTEWIRFYLTAALLCFSLFCFGTAVLGVWRFGYVMNRMHAAGIGDTLGLGSLLLALMISAGLSMDTLKMLILVVFMWTTSPTSSHFLAQIEYFTNPELYRNTRRKDPYESD